MRVSSHSSVSYEVHMRFVHVRAVYVYVWMCVRVCMYGACEREWAQEIC